MFGFQLFSSSTSTVFFVAGLSLQGAVFEDSYKKKSYRIELTSDGRTATKTKGTGRAIIVGRHGYLAGTVVWRMRLSNSGRNARYSRNAAIGVTTLPLAGNFHEKSYTTSYVWTTDDGKARSLDYYRPLNLQEITGGWRNNETLRLTLDCDQQQLHLQVERTGETRMMEMDRRGRPLYLVFFMYWEGQKVTIL